ncbi:MAG TPA: thioesterase family protein [Solirubrobacteraceae bacterium]|jgi:acyl-CoA thioester hydrolase
MAEQITEAADGVDAAPAFYVHRLRVRYAECDPQGVVFNPQYLAFADHALTELWRELFGGYMAMLDRGVDVVVAEARLRFRASARFDEELDVAVDVAHLGTTSMTFHYLITRAADGVRLAEVELRYVWMDRATGAKTPIPDWARGKLAP